MEKTIFDILIKASDCYYNTGDLYEASEAECNEVIETLGIPCQPLMTDTMFDAIYFKAKEMFPDNPFFLSVGSNVRGAKVQLPINLGSMTEAKEGDMERWMVPGHYCISNKLDGISCLLAYENGKLKIAYSRGDGYMGQDITRTVKQLASVPENLTENFTGYVRGEIIIPKADIQKCIDELKEETNKEYKNGRNLCAGQLNAEVANKAFIKYAHFVSYHIHNWNNVTHTMFEKLAQLGFETTQWMISDNLMMTDDYLEALIKNVKENYIYECDGIICTMEVVDDDHQGFETGTLNPKNSRKVKIGLKAFNTKECEVLGIKWQIGKNLKFTPVIQITPVELNGVTVSNVTGHNYKFIIDNNITVGSKGLVTRAGDVIPYWMKTTWSPLDNFDKVKENVFENWDDALLNKFFGLPLPKQCLELDGVDLVLGAEHEDSENEYRSYLFEAFLQQTLYFCTKLGVEFGGYGNIKALSNEVGHPIDYTDLVTLSQDVFETAIGVNGIKFYDSLHQKVLNATPTQLADAAGVFGEGIGELKLNKIVDKYGDLPYDGKKVIETEGWAEKSTDQYMTNYVRYANMVTFFQENNMWKGFTIIEAKGDKCKDIKVVFTGIRSAEMEDVIRQNGGRVLNSFTKECNLVIAKDVLGSSGKLAKAREKGIEVISLDEAFKRFGHKVEENKSIENLNNPLANALKM